MERIKGQRSRRILFTTTQPDKSYYSFVYSWYEKIQHLLDGRIGSLKP